MSKKDAEYIGRIAERAQTIRNRLETTQLRDKQEITKELHALDWALAKLSARPEAATLTRFSATDEALEEDPDGAWVRYRDVEALLSSSTPQRSDAPK